MLFGEQLSGFKTSVHSVQFITVIQNIWHQRNDCKSPKSCIKTFSQVATLWQYYYRLLFNISRLSHLPNIYIYVSNMEKYVKESKILSCCLITGQHWRDFSDERGSWAVFHCFIAQQHIYFCHSLDFHSSAPLPRFSQVSIS